MRPGSEMPPWLDVMAPVGIELLSVQAEARKQSQYYCDNR
jgi:hypothetical protein